MRLFVTFVLILCSAISALAQQQSPLNLVSSSGGRLSKDGNAMFYRPVYEHNQSTLSADSGYIYEDEDGKQFFEAFGNVIITQPSGTVIYSDKLHYDAAYEFATLTNNVRMVDDGGVLTTHHLTYDMRRGQGTYTKGGRIVNQGDTITSQNAYYFERTKDTYFRNKVVVRTPDMQIYTDTMRYNSGERETYFYGPTDLKANDGGNLYTEKGHYNTASGLAHFSLNNLYTEESRFLKSDSLFYDRANGFGEAFRNVVFVDTADNFFAYGGYGKYSQEDESITMTDKPLVISVVKDSVKTDSTERTSALTPEDSVSQPAALTADSLEEKEILKDENQNNVQESVEKNQKDSLPDAHFHQKTDSIYLTADTLFSKMIFLKDYEPLELNLDRDGGELIVEEEDFVDDTMFSEGDDLQIGETIGDEVSLDPESTDLAKDFQIEEEKTEEPIKKDKITIPKTVQDTSQKTLSAIEKTVKEDESLRKDAEMPSTAKTDSLMSSVMTSLQTPKLPKDSLETPSDTTKTRILKAYKNVRLFKSDLQAVADSAYYGEADSMFRFFGSPMIWAEGSQISADTIFMQVKNEQLDNALLLENAFMVNAVLDTVKFNQLKGKKITAFFTNNEIELIYVDGNAENLIFSTNEKANVVTEMFHDRSGRIKIVMKDNEILRYTSIRKIDQKVYPLKMVNQDNEILPGFVWKPQDRPKSKEDLLNRSRNKESQTETAVSEGESTENPDEGKEKETKTEEIQEFGDETENTSTEVEKEEVEEETTTEEENESNES